ncbi:MAG: hypothetical protein HRT47_13175 [Candidatus Caenarcaniphilales bacterium]|nr:hypothetical protein [Candidatus Caenarcaniphilales bacterium]
MGIEKTIMTIFGAILLTTLILSFPLSIMYDHYVWKKRNGRLNPNKSFLQNFWGS